MKPERITDLRLEWDETPPGLFLIFETEEFGREYEFGITDPEALHEEVLSVIGPWLSEMRAVQSERAVAIREGGGLRVEPDEDAYDITDPKHPRHHEVMADIADLKEDA
jgi:hypothetical protein